MHALEISVDHACEKIATAVPTTRHSSIEKNPGGGGGVDRPRFIEPQLSKPSSADGSFHARDGGRADGVPVARPLTRQWPDRKGIPPQMHQAFLHGDPATFRKTWRRFEAMGRPQSMRRERRRRRASLENTPNRVRVDQPEPSPGRDTVRILGCGCGRHVCQRCGRRIGWRVRENIKRRLRELQAAAGVEGDAMMLTLTVDPKKFSGPRQAWESVRANRRVSRTMQAMGITHYVAVVEFQKSGMPHWHIFVWKPGVIFVGHRELEAAWKVGICRFTARNGRPMEWAVNYITKYITKPDDAPPEWVMELHHVRSCWGSRPWGAIGDGEPSDDDEDTDSMVAVREIRSNAEAVAGCSASCVAIVEHVSQDGELHRKYLGKFPVHVRWMRAMVSRLTGAHQVRSMVMAIESAAWQRLRNALPLVE